MANEIRSETDGHVAMPRALKRYWLSALAICLIAIVAALGYSESSPPTSAPSEPDACRQLLDSARTAYQRGVLENEAIGNADGQGDGPHIAQGRRAFSEAVRLCSDTRIRTSQPELAATILGEDAWFRLAAGVPERLVSEEVRKALQINPQDPTLHYKLAVLLTNEEGSSAGNDPVSDKPIVSELDEAIKLDVNMPEAYLLMGKLMGGNQKERMVDMEKFLKYADKVRPELWNYADQSIELEIKGTSRYLARYPTSQAITDTTQR